MTDDDLTQATLFDVFSNARRRRTVEYLKRTNGSCDLSSLVERVAAWENGVDTDAVSRTQRRRVYISLYQTHLPMLDEHGIVEWDADAHRIELVHDADRFDRYLDHAPAVDIPWEYVYASVAGGGAVAFGFAWLAIGPFGALTAPVIAFACSVVILFVAVSQQLSRRAVRFEPPSPLDR